MHVNQKLYAYKNKKAAFKRHPDIMPIGMPFTVILFYRSITDKTFTIIRSRTFQSVFMI